MFFHRRLFGLRFFVCSEPRKHLTNRHQCR
nr:MAG TPA: hypothetical protein [Caudoviricetes sp.]